MDALDLVAELDLYEPADVDHGAGQRGAFGPVVAQPEAFEPQQPGDGAFDDPADSPAAAGIEHEQDPLQRGTVIDPGPPTRTARPWSGRDQGFDQRPEPVRSQGSMSRATARM